MMIKIPEAKKESLGLALNEVAAEIGAKLDDARKPWPPSDHSLNNWSSEYHHPCLKNLVHCRLDWKKRQPIDSDGKWRVDEGIDKEWFIKKWLGDIGFELSQSQRRYSTDDPGMEKYKHLHISGKIDGLCPLKKELPEPFAKLREVPAEIKTVNQNFWESTKTIEDLKRHSKHWIQKYPSQLNAYLIMGNSPGGFMIIATFGKKPRILPMLFDLELWEQDKARVEKVNAHVAAGTYPEPIPFDATICGMCDFDHICNPLRTTGVVEIPETAEFELEMYLELKEKKTEFTALHKELVGDAEKPGKYFDQEGFLNDIEIKTKRSPRAKYPVPKDIKDRYREDYTLVQTSIKRITKT